MSNHVANKKLSMNDGGYGIFWDEYHSIEQSAPPQQSQQPDIEDGHLKKEDKNESEIQWLNDVGFTNIARKIRARTEIDRNDDDMRIIAASLTRAQANAVRRRIDSLNEAIRLRKMNDERNYTNQKSRSKRKDVRNLFENSQKTTLNDSKEKLPQRLKMNGQRYVSIPGHDSLRRSEDYDLTSKDALSPTQDASLKQDTERSPRSSRLEDLTITNTIRSTDNNSQQTKSDPFTQYAQQLSPTLRRVQDQTPQIDNLVRRTSSSQLIFMTGDERQRAIQADSHQGVTRRNTDLGPKILKTDAERSHCKTNYANGPVTTYEVHGSAVISSPKSQFVSGGEKRLVIVDSKYININSVSDTYKSIQTNEVKRAATYAQGDVYNNTRPIHIPVKPNRTFSDQKIQGIDENYAIQSDISRSDYSNDNQAELEQNRSQPSSSDINKWSPETQQKPSKPKQVPLEVPIPCYERLSIKDLSDTDRKSKTSSTSSSTEHLPSSPKLKHSEINKDSSKKTEPRTKKCTSSEKPKMTLFEGIENKLSKTFSSSLSNKSMQERTTPVSDDNKSLSSYSSLGSSDDLQLSPMSDKNFESTIDNKQRLTPEKHGRSSSDLEIRPTPRGESPGVGLEGDAKLNVGSANSPRDSLTSQDIVQGPTFPPLPNFTLTREELGMTHVGDLSEDDMIKVRSLALLELTALFDAFSIPMNRRKTPAKQKHKDNGIFGVPLIVTCQRGQIKKDHTPRAPKVFLEMIRYLETYGLHEEGILRIPGSAPRVKAFREDCDKNKLNESSFEGKKASDIATCLKQFLRDLPIPLLSYEYQNSFTSVADLPDRKVQLQALNLLVLLLHPYHQETLRVLLVFLNKIIVNEPFNKMGLNNVAMIMAPNLFFQNNTKISIDEASKAAGMTDVLRMLIKYQKILWTIPAFMVGQIRYLCEAGTKTKDPKAVRKIIAKRLKTEGPITTPAGHRGKSSGSSGDELEDFEENLIIRVKAPSLNKQSMAIQLLEHTTAADVVAKFQWRRQNSHKEKDEIDTSRLSINRSSGKKKDANMELYLCEAGGNIGERRLDPTANLTSVLKVNPNTEWVLKGRVKKR